jgi:hypothetical protein
MSKFPIQISKNVIVVVFNDRQIGLLRDAKGYKGRNLDLGEWMLSF